MTNDSTATTAITTAPTNSESATSMLAIITFILALLSLCVSAYQFWQNRQATLRRPTDRLPADNPLTELGQRVVVLEQERNALLRRIKALEDTRPAAPAPTQPQNTVRPATSPASPPVQPPVNDPPRPAQPVAQAQRPAEVTPSAPMPYAPSPAPPAPRPIPQTFYGRTADLGDGFSVGGLLTVPDRDTIFEIHTRGTGQADFQVSDTPDLQRLALSDPYSYLNDTCAYTAQPRPGARIVTIQPGRLHLQGEKWVIIDKARISFQ